MRLICPNCGAQYDVPDDAVPAAGREVQCSSCGHTWFEITMPPAPAASAIIPPEVISDASPDIEPTTPPDAPVLDDAPDADARRPVDASVKAILQEEAARERALRDTPPQETPVQAQPPEPEPVSPTVAPEDLRQRIAAFAEDAEEEKPVPQVAPTPPVVTTLPALRANPEPVQRDMPTMNEINASLRARSQTASPTLTPHEEQEVVNRQGFRRGFFIVLLILAILFAPYIFAGQITQAFPQLQDTMTAYVATIDQLRLMLNQGTAALTDWIAGVTGGSPTGS